MSEARREIIGDAPTTSLEYFESQRPRLVALCARIVGSDAEDIVQEALLKLETDPITARPLIEQSAWLRRVCLNLSFNRRRDVGRWRDRAVRGGGLAERPDEPDHLAVRRDEQDRVRHVLDRMTHRGRTILMLRYSGYSYAEIASTLEMPTSSVGTTLARAERAFRELYEETYP